MTFMDNAQYQYVPARTNHILHFLMTCMTLGLWLPIWFFAWLRNRGRMVAKRLPQPVFYPPYGGPYGGPWQQFHQMPPSVPGPEAEGLQRAQGGYDQQRPT